MRRRENCLNSTVDLRIQDKSYTNHIMTLRRIKPSIETTQPETPLHFSLHQDSWEKNREENIERSNLLQSRTQFSKTKSFNDTNNKSVSFSGITARSQSKNRPSTSYSTPKIYNKSSSRSQNNYHISESQVFLTQTNVKQQPKQKSRNKTKIDIFLSKTPPNQWKQVDLSNKEENENDDEHNSQVEPKKKKIERSPYRPAAKKVLKMQKIVSNQFNKRYLRTEMAIRKSYNMNSESNFETDSECVANITDDTLTSENSILKNASLILRSSTGENDKEVANNTNNKIDNDLDEDFEKFDDDDEKETSDELQKETVNSRSSKSNESSGSSAKDDQIYNSEHSNNDELKDHPENENKKKRRKVIRKKVRKVRVVHQPHNDDTDDLQEINLSDN